jgi:quercetin dioxygenase-like cupin family protein
VPLPAKPPEFAAVRISRADAPIPAVGGERAESDTTMQIVRAGDAKPEATGAFTGKSDLRRLLTAQQPGGLAATIVHFEDGARTNWHVHPGEQVLYIVEGQGRAGTEAEAFSVGPGDLVYSPPGERHWHGAAPGAAMTHLSVTTVGAPEWFEAPE